MLSVRIGPLENNLYDDRTEGYAGFKQRFYWLRNHHDDVLTSSKAMSEAVTDRSRAKQLWLVCGVMGDVMLCDRERDIHRSHKFYATIHSEK
jgi:hypothetical protein